MKANPDLDKWDQMRLLSQASSILYFSTPPNKRAATVAPLLEMLDDELEVVKTKDKGDPGMLAWEAGLLLDNKSQILLAEKRLPEASQALGQWAGYWTGSEDSSLDGVWAHDWRVVQNQKGQPAQAVAGLIRVFEGRLPRRATFAQNLNASIVDELVTQDKTEEALSWAKLQFMLCPFGKGAVEDATKDVNRCLSAGELTLAKVNAFAGAQADPAAPNPLDAVPLPTLDTKAVRALLADPSAKVSPGTRLTCLLVVGDYKGAMVLAKSRLVADVANQDNALEVARVFKAKDGDIARANQFLAYYQTGQGTNPLPAFLKETETAKPSGSAASTVQATQ